MQWTGALPKVLKLGMLEMEGRVGNKLGSNTRTHKLHTTPVTHPWLAHPRQDQHDFTSLRRLAARHNRARDCRPIGTIDSTRQCHEGARGLGGVFCKKKSELKICTQS